MLRHLKVPTAALVAGLALAACGGEAESAADLESAEMEEMIEAEVEARVQERLAEEAPAEPAPAEPAPAAPSGSGSGSASAPPPPPASEPEPEPEPEPDPVTRPADEPPPAEAEAPTATIGAGALLTAVVDEEISTSSHEVGSPFRLRVSEDLWDDGILLVPAGAHLEGRIAEARRSTGPDEEAALVLEFEHLVVDGEAYPLLATLVEAELESSAGDSGTRSIAKVATGAAAGAVIGQILGRDTRSTVQGAAAGAVAGAGVALTTRDGHAVIREGSTIVVQVDAPVALVAGR